MEQAIHLLSPLEELLHKARKQSAPRVIMSQKEGRSPIDRKIGQMTHQQDRLHHLYLAEKNSHHWFL